MDYKLELQNNNVDLQSLIDKASALPDAAINNGIDTSDATATANDIAVGATAYVNGEKIEGVIPEITSEDMSVTFNYASLEKFNNSLTAMEIYGTIDNDIIARKDALIGVNVSRSNMNIFGNATPSDVVKGKTFTSTSGAVVTGTHVCTSGTDTSDATATADDILSGKTAYINGGKVTGSLVVNAYYTGDVEPDNSFGNDGDLYFVRGE